MIPPISHTDGPMSIAMLNGGYMREAAIEHGVAVNSSWDLVKTNKSIDPESMRFSITSGGQIDGRDLSRPRDVADMRKWNGLLVSDCDSKASCFVRHSRSFQ
jgi:hypothetical protein